MFELNVKYSTKEVAEKIGITYQTLRKAREKYENHLKLFYDFEIEHKGSTIYYVFTEQFSEYIPYFEYHYNKKTKLVREKVEKVLATNNRQTGSNIARLIKVDGDIQVLNWELSTLTVYARAELKALVDAGLYIREDYRWCYLDEKTNTYILMSDEEVAELRSYFSEENKAISAEEEELWSNYKDRIITREEFKNKLCDIRCNCFERGVKRFYTEHHVWPINVPTYVPALSFQ